MDRKRARGVALAVLATAAVALTAVAAGPLFSQQQGAENPGGTQTPGPEQTPTSGGIELPIEAIVAAIVVVGAVGFLVQFARDPRETFKASAKLVVYGVVLVGVLTYLYRTVDIDYFSAEGERGVPGANMSFTPTSTPTPTGGGFGEGSSDPLVFPVENLLVVAVVGAAVGLVAVLAWRSGTVQSVLGLGDEAADSGPESDGLDEVAQVAGDAADRVESAPTPSAADDAVYGAWRDMVALLGVDDPQASTPRQFERLAVEAGMDDEDVATLTHAFEEVRYDDATLSADRRDRVTDAFRRIQAAHGTDAESGSESR